RFRAEEEGAQSRDLALAFLEAQRIAHDRGGSGVERIPDDDDGLAQEGPPLRLRLSAFEKQAVVQPDVADRTAPVPDTHAHDLADGVGAQQARDALQVTRVEGRDELVEQRFADWREGARATRRGELFAPAVQRRLNGPHGR